jgi:hypothetical protein
MSLTTRTVGDIRVNEWIAEASRREAAALKGDKN